MPARRDQSGRSGDRPRIPRAIGEVVAEQVAFVGHHDDVVSGGALRERRDLLLHLLVAAVGATAAWRAR